MYVKRIPSYTLPSPARLLSRLSSFLTLPPPLSPVVCHPRNIAVEAGRADVHHRGGGNHRCHHGHAGGLGWCALEEPGGDLPGARNRQMDAVCVCVSMYVCMRWDGARIIEEVRGDRGRRGEKK